MRAVRRSLGRRLVAGRTEVHQTGLPVELVLIHQTAMPALLQQRIDTRNEIDTGRADVIFAKLAAVVPVGQRILVRLDLIPEAFDSCLLHLSVEYPEALMRNGESVVNDPDYRALLAHSGQRLRRLDQLDGSGPVIRGLDRRPKLDALHSETLRVGMQRLQVAGPHDCGAATCVGKAGRRLTRHRRQGRRVGPVPGSAPAPVPWQTAGGVP